MNHEPESGCDASSGHLLFPLLAVFVLVVVFLFANSQPLPRRTTFTVIPTATKTSEGKNE